MCFPNYNAMVIPAGYLNTHGTLVDGRIHHLAAPMMARLGDGSNPASPSKFSHAVIDWRYMNGTSDYVKPDWEPVIP